MTSKECFVYITLPNTSDFVTAGKFILTTLDDGQVSGKFFYGKSYLARPDAVAIDPIELKLTTDVYETKDLKGVFGAIRDASPDLWGRRLIERYIGSVSLDEMEYLLHSPDDRMGALGFGINKIPPAPKRLFNQMLDLEKLQNIAEEIIKNDGIFTTDKEKQSQVEKLLLLGTSMGGARPKAVVESDDALWVAKFNCSDDSWNNALVEYAMLKLAKKCGLCVAESRVVKVGNRDVLLVKRFDRESREQKYLRFRMMSAMTALQAGDEYTERSKWSYIFLAEEMRRFCAYAKTDVQELFKRMVFNALISNTDDHPRNHAFVAKNKEWHLSPGYDLTPNPLRSVERRDLALVCGENGRFANADNLISNCGAFLLKKEEAQTIIQDMQNIVAREWYNTARSVGVTEVDCDRIKSAFVYEGFNYKI